jgi:hypothetical protein
MSAVIPFTPSSPITARPDRDVGSTLASPAVERRAHARRRAEELPWVSGIRLKFGPPVSLIDLSSSGAQIDTASYRLQPGSNVVVEIAGPDTQLAVRSKVVRCHVSAIAPQTIYRGAVAFDCPLELPGARSITSAEWNRVVARYADGRLLRGFCRDFLPSSGAVEVWALPDAPQQARIKIPVHFLEALEFLDEPADNSARTGALALEEIRSGRLIITLHDGTLLMGALESHQSEVGFFLAPLEPPNQAVRRTFVFAHAVKRAEWLPE